jgi:hypothetical protein
MSLNLRKYPYPYRSMLAICSDLDETPNGDVYFETCRYLNTEDITEYGKGVGLEVGNSIYFSMPSGQFSYWNGDDSERECIRKLIKSGHIDCLHSFGDLVCDRNQILTNWRELQNNGCSLKVWIDHATAATNLDPDIMKGSGAFEGSEAFHTDLTFADDGIKYVWKGRVTSVIAQNARRSYRGILNVEHIRDSTKTMLVEAAKGVLGRFGSKKYAMHTANRVMRKTKLADGTPTMEFMRCNPSWAGVSMFEKGKDIGRVLTPKMMDILVRKEGCSILYTHLGKIKDVKKPFGELGKQALEQLSRRYQNGEILVLTTRRLLDYQRLVSEIRFYINAVGDRWQVRIDSSSIPKGIKLHGLTWYTDTPEKVDVYLDDHKLTEIVINDVDEKGMRSISLPFSKLSFPTL